jgi:outer membrane protein assembly factor BamD (BamD/ComL family)
MKFTIGVLLLPLAIAVVGCAKPGPKELYDRADQAEARAIKMMDTVRDEAAVRQAFAPALDNFRMLQESYPNDTLAEVALFRSGNIRNNFTHEIPEAVADFKQYVERYPNGQQTEVAMFLIGFLYNNSLHQLDSAGAAYRRFLERFPASQYATAAQFELNTLGEPPEAILPPPAPLETPKKTSKPSRSPA